MFARTLVKSLVVIACAAVSAVAGPKITVSDQDFNFGKIPQHAVAIHRFWLKSTGGTRVKITKAEPDCGCTSLSLKDSVIAPGDSLPLDVTFHTRAFIGYLIKRPTVEIEGSTEKTVVQFRAEIVTDPTTTMPLVINPAEVDVSQFSEKPRRRGTFTITNKSNQDYTIKIIDSTLKSFEVKLPTVIKAGEQVIGEVRVKKALLTTSFEQAFTFEINDATRTHFSVPVNRLYNPNNDPAMSLSSGQ